MANWFERAKRQILQSASRVTANTAERNLTAVMAVPEPRKSEISRVSIGSNGSASLASFRETAAISTSTVAMTQGEESAIRDWLAHINETDPAVITYLLDKCRTDADARGYYVGLSAKVPRPRPFGDDRRRCEQCANLTDRGLCLAARRGEILATPTYEPVRDLPRRCEGYAPGPDDPDRRSGAERWPGLIQKGEEHANT